MRLVMVYTNKITNAHPTKERHSEGTAIAGTTAKSLCIMLITSLTAANWWKRVDLSLSLHLLNPR